MKNRRELSLHVAFLLLSLVIPLFFFMLLRLNVNNTYYAMLFLNSPFIFWLLILSLKDRLLSIEEIDLYASVSSKLMFLTVALPGIRAVFRYHTFYNVEGIYYWYIIGGSVYAYTLPYEYFIILIPVLIYCFATRNWSMLGGQTGPLLLMSPNLGILSLYLILLYWKKKYRTGAAKIIFICSIITNIIMLLIITTATLVINSLIYLIYLLYLALNAYRLANMYKKQI